MEYGLGGCGSEARSATETWLTRNPTQNHHSEFQPCCAGWSPPMAARSRRIRLWQGSTLRTQAASFASQDVRWRAVAQAARCGAMPAFEGGRRVAPRARPSPNLVASRRLAPETPAEAARTLQ